MFFAPTLLFFNLSGVQIHLLCVTSGNFEGLGPTRRSELYAAASVYGIRPNNVQFVDPEEHFFKDDFQPWNTSDLSAVLFTFINRTRPDGLITFDGWGISGHPNHIDCFRSISDLKATGRLSGTGVKKVLALESVSIGRKYIGIADFLLSKYIGFGKQFTTLSANPTKFDIKNISYIFIISFCWIVPD